MILLFVSNETEKHHLKQCKMFVILSISGKMIPVVLHLIWTDNHKMATRMSYLFEWISLVTYLELTIYLWVVLFLRLNYVLCSVSTFTVRISSYIDTLIYKYIYLWKERKCLFKKTQTKKLLNCVLLCNRLYSSGLCFTLSRSRVQSTVARKRKSQQQSARSKASS